MVEIEIPTPAGDICEIVQAAFSRFGLTVASNTELKKYPGSRHWHLRKPGSSGTLEVTFWPERGRLWVAYHSNRVGDGWVESAARLLADEIRG